MTVGTICNREVVVVAKEGSIREAAELMRRYHVGDLVVIEERPGGRVPVGLITDRDLVVEVLAADLALDAVTVGDVMSNELVTVREDVGIWDALQRMRARAVRRIPVVDERGGLVGILALDDLLELLAGELADLVKIVDREQDRERRSRP